MPQEAEIATSGLFPWAEVPHERASGCREFSRKALDVFAPLHAQTRARQRAIPPLIEAWLDQYGEEDYDGHGGCRIFFSKGSIRRMERDFGRAPVKKMAEWLDAYKVEDSRSGRVITIGRRYRHLKRR